MGRLALAVLASVIVVLAVASSAVAAVPPGSTYLALGDSVSFGYQEPNVVPPPNYKDQSSFLGWPERAALALNLKVTNSSCPGETSASFINPKALSNGCENSPSQPHAGYRTRYPLHVKYSGSQLDFAISFLRKNPKTAVVTLMIGANDVFLCQSQTSDGCTSTSEQQTLYKNVAKNVKTIMTGLRTRAKYTGPIVLMRYYSLDYNSSLVTGVVSGLNSAVYNAAKSFKPVLVADGFKQFHDGSIKAGNDPCKAGLLTQLSTGSCGVHPTWAGQGLLALALAQKIT